MTGLDPALTAGGSVAVDTPVADSINSTSQVEADIFAAVAKLAKALGYGDSTAMTQYLSQTRTRLANGPSGRWRYLSMHPGQRLAASPP